MKPIHSTKEDMLQQATAIAVKVATYFAVQAPEVVLLPTRGRRAFCWYSYRGPCKITFSYFLWQDLESAIVHEMAHVVCWERHRLRGHSSKFQAVLHAIAAFYFGDASKYRYDLEYHAVAASAGVTINNAHRRRESLITSLMRGGCSREKAEQVIDE